ncbi:MAG: hypothetical protein U1A28_00220, partial [Patescibacteria group bacterium]|nr:hypothetical protein [Patescibacteria group bacterium]
YRINGTFLEMRESLEVYAVLHKELRIDRHTSEEQCGFHTCCPPRDIAVLRVCLWSDGDRLSTPSRWSREEITAVDSVQDSIAELREEP